MTSCTEAAVHSIPAIPNPLFHYPLLSYAIPIHVLMYEISSGSFFLLLPSTPVGLSDINNGHDIELIVSLKFEYLTITTDSEMWKHGR